MHEASACSYSVLNCQLLLQPPSKTNFFFCFLGPHPWHMEFIYSQARGPIGALAAGLCHSSQQHRILNPLNEARDQTHNFMVPSWIHFCCTTMGTPCLTLLTFGFYIFDIINNRSECAGAYVPHVVNFSFG